MHIMENDLSTPAETSDEQGRPISKVRSYDCTFCKRGFTNAQALGGHMNMHRKDKAKLKKDSTETQQQAFDVSKVASLYSPISTYTPQPQQIKFSEERSTIIKWPWILTTHGEVDDATTREEKLTRAGDLQQLLLFSERVPSNVEDQRLSSHFGANTEKCLSSSYGSPSMELDLELRLGPEPQDSSAAVGTKRLF
ncbi:hypothetical protein L1049_013380 [Liquidambar formosana]|uniref:C2H2-type domain-containing protein n=1 Tax=Liquidambar formosana TaxID=63359 RepID=A0AAP0WYB1_LIQFO